MNHRFHMVVINRLHTNETWIGDAVDVLFQRLPKIPNVTFVTRKVPEYARHQRGIVENIAIDFRCRPDGNPDEQFADEIRAAAQGADLVLDLHGAFAGDYAFCGEHPTDLALRVAGLFSQNVMHCPLPHAASVLPNYVGWDITPASVERVIELLPEMLVQLVRGWRPPMLPLHHYRSIPRTISVSDAQRLGLARTYQQFEPLPAVVTELGLPPTAVADGWNADRNEHRGFYGEVAVPHPAPNNSVDDGGYVVLDPPMFITAQGTVSAQPVRIDELKVGDRVVIDVGPPGAFPTDRYKIYRVTNPWRYERNEHGKIQLYNETLTAKQADEISADPDWDKGEDPRVCNMCHWYQAKLNRVIE